MDGTGPWMPLIGMVFSGITLLGGAWMVMSFMARKQQARTVAEFHARLLDRIGSTRDFAEFLNSEGGSRFVDSIALRRDVRPKDRAVGGLFTGIVLTVLGVGLAMFAGEIPSQRDFALVVGFLSAIALSLGIGLLVATWGTLTIASRLGLLETDTPRKDEHPTV